LKKKKTCSTMKLKLERKFKRVCQKKRIRMLQGFVKYAKLRNEEELSDKGEQVRSTSKHRGTVNKFKYSKQRDSVNWDTIDHHGDVVNFTPLVVETFD